ncbi:MAG: ATP-grasp domain-containing protein [Deltaproteobacteria bacterium]|nr:ATP-grasp domain-containing protein [Deltaproteobacteria bacterium]
MLSLTVISHSEAYYSTRRLLEAGQRLGYDVRRLDPVRVVLVVAPRPTITEDGVEWPVPDVVVPRIGATLQTWSLALLEAWLQRGARSALSPEALVRASDKVLTALRLAEQGVPTVPTAAIREPFHVDHALDAVPHEGAWVFKTRLGTGGTGVALAPGRSSARSVLGALVIDRETVLVQPFLTTRPTRDLRVLVAGYEPLACAWRVAPDDDFRANVHRGATMRAVSPEDAPAGALDLAVAAARAAALPFAGIDLIETSNGLTVLEVNGSPGFQGIEEATGKDLATPFLQRFAAWP